MAQNHNDGTSTHLSEKSAQSPHVIGVHGAIEQHTTATHALSETLRAAEDAGATVELIDLAELTLPRYSPDQPVPEDAAAFVDRLSTADGVVLATSVRHDSYSALLKSALDYCDSDELGNKPVGLLAVTEGSGPALALEHLRTVCRKLNARVPPMQVSIDVTWKGNELPAESVNALRKLGYEVVDER